MKNFILSLIAATLILSSCTKQNQFKVTLNLDNADGQTVFLYKDVNGQNVFVDSAVFAGKTVELKADFGEPQTCYIITFDPSQQCGSFPFFTENQNTTITGNKDAFQYWIVKGCAAMDIYNTYRQAMLPTEESLLALYSEMEQAYMEGDTIKSAELNTLVGNAMEDYQEMILDFIRGHADSYVAHFLLNQMKMDYDLDKLKEVTELFTTESAYSKEIKEYIELGQQMGIEQPEMVVTQNP